MKVYNREREREREVSAWEKELDGAQNIRSAMRYRECGGERDL